MEQKEKNLMIRQYLTNIFMLCQNNVKDKKMYQIELESLKDYMDLQIDEEESMKKVMDSLEKYADDTEENARLVTEDAKTKASFWLEYMKWAMWQTLRDEGIGHLSKFYLQRSIIVCEVHVDVNVSKNYGESKQEFEERKFAFEKKLLAADLDIVHHDILGRSLRFTEKNKKYLEDYMKQYCDIVSVKYTLWEDSIRTMEFYIRKDAKFNFFKRNDTKNTEELTDAKIEEIMESVKNWYSSLSMTEEFDSEKLKSTSDRLAATMYNSIAYAVDYENEELKEYRTKRDSKRERNKILNQKKEEIGITYDNKILQEINGELTEKISKYLTEKYCLYLSEMRTSEIVELEITWNVNEYGMLEYGETQFDIKNVKKTFEFPSFMPTSNSYLIFNDRNVNALSDIAKRLCGEIKDINISYNYGTQTINKVCIVVRNLNELLRKF